VSKWGQRLPYSLVLQRVEQVGRTFTARMFALLLAMLTVILGFGIVAAFQWHSRSSRLVRSACSGVRTRIETRLWGLGKAPALKGKSTCKLCRGTGGVPCLPCGGRGVDRIKGDMFQRWMCKVCCGFGNVSCSCTGARGLTPEQTGER
jgi:hypothetical protein